jgi:CubicO group peptidase (beta-lactamase class C family)
MKIAILLMAFCMALCAKADDREVQIDALWAPFKNTAGVSFAIIENGKFAYEKQFGYSELVTKTPITKNTKFLIGSCSKQFTAMAIALLEEKGLCKASDPIQMYIPELRTLGNTSLLNLIQHVSGYRDYLNLAVISGTGLPHFALERIEAFEIVRRQESLGFVPNSKWDYSNTGYLLMEFVVEKISGIPFEDFLKKHIFGPLGMKNSHASSDSSQIIPDAAYGYIPQPTRVIHAPYISNCITGAGGIQMTMGDWFLFDQNFYNNKLGIGGQALIQKLNGQSHGYAYGLQVTQQGPNLLVHHTGAFPGFLTSMVRVVNRNTTFIMMSNIADESVYNRANTAAQIWMRMKTGFKLERLDEISPFPRGISLSGRNDESKHVNLDKYLGFYHSRELNRAYYLRMLGNQMVTNVRGVGWVPLILKGSGNEFWIGAVNGPSGIFYESGGVVTGMEFIDFSRAAHIRFQKLDKEPICSWR